MKANEEIPHEQDANFKRIGRYVRNWYRWVKTGVELDSHGMIELKYLINTIHLTVFAGPQKYKHQNNMDD